MTYDEFNTGGCNGCRYHGKNDDDYYRYLDGSPRNDTCSHPETVAKEGYSPVPIFNVGCKRWTA